MVQKIQYAGDPQFTHHCYKSTWLTAISSHCLDALPAKMSAFNSYIRQNAFHYRTSDRRLPNVTPTTTVQFVKML